jgi:hypothetical protein
MDPPRPPLPHMVVHLSRIYLGSTMLKESLGNSYEVDLLEPFVSMPAGFDDLTHLLQHEGGLEWQPLHGALYHRSMHFAGCASIKHLPLLPFPSKVHGNL